MKPYVPITAAILVPLLALEPSCATSAPRQQLRLAFLDENGRAGEEDQGVVAPEPAPIVELSDAEVAEGNADSSKHEGNRIAHEHDEREHQEHED